MCPKKSFRSPKKLFSLLFFLLPRFSMPLNAARASRTTSKEVSRLPKKKWSSSSHAGKKNDPKVQASSEEPSKKADWTLLGCLKYEEKKLAIFITPSEQVVLRKEGSWLGPLQVYRIEPEEVVLKQYAREKVSYTTRRSCKLGESIASPSELPLPKQFLSPASFLSYEEGPQGGGEPTPHWVHLKSCPLEAILHALRRCGLFFSPQDLFPEGLPRKVSARTWAASSPSLIHQIQRSFRLTSEPSRFDLKERSAASPEEETEELWMAFQHRPLKELEEKIHHELKIISQTAKAFLFYEQNLLKIKDQVSLLPEIHQWLSQLDQPVPQFKAELKVVFLSKERCDAFGLGFPTSINFKGEQTTEQFKTTPLSLNPLNSRWGTLFKKLLAQGGEVLDLEFSALELQGEASVLYTPTLTLRNQTPASLKHSIEHESVETTNKGKQKRTPKLPEGLDLTLTATQAPRNQVLLNVSLHHRLPTSASCGMESTLSAPYHQMVQTEVTAQEGETLLLGGMKTHYQLGKRKGLPLLSRIPILKWLACKDSQANSEVMGLFLLRITKAPPLPGCGN